MEQQWSPGRARQETQSRDRAEQDRRTPERERLDHAGQTARAALEGAPLLQMPPGRLEELAGWLGNQGMNELLEAQSPPLEEACFTLPAEEAQTLPFPVPEMNHETAVPPQGLAAQAGGWAGGPGAPGRG